MSSFFCTDSPVYFTCTAARYTCTFQDTSLVHSCLHLHLYWKNSIFNIYLSKKYIVVIYCCRLITYTPVVTNLRYALSPTESQWPVGHRVLTLTRTLINDQI